MERVWTLDEVKIGILQSGPAGTEAGPIKPGHTGAADEIPWRSANHQALICVPVPRFCVFCCRWNRGSTSMNESALLWIIVSLVRFNGTNFSYCGLVVVPLCDKKAGRRCRFPRFHHLSTCWCLLKPVLRVVLLPMAKVKIIMIVHLKEKVWIQCKIQKLMIL